MEVDVVTEDAAVPGLRDRQLDGEAFERRRLVAGQRFVVRVDAELVCAFELTVLRAIEDDRSRSACRRRRRVEVAQREDPERKGEAGHDIDRIGLLEVVHDGTEGSGWVNRHEVRRWYRHHRRHAAVVEVDPLR